VNETSALDYCDTIISIEKVAPSYCDH